MRRKLLVLAGLLWICVFSLGNKPAFAASFCSGTYCNANPNGVCQCPPGTKAWPSTGLVDCFTWRADCNYL